MVMGKKTETVKHSIAFGYSFYPITYKNKKYVIEISELSKKYVDIYEYKEKKSFFKGHKGKKLCSYDCTDFAYKERPDGDVTFVLSIYTNGFRENYPDIIKGILEDMEIRLAYQRAKEEKLRKIEEWDGVIK